MVFVFVFAFSHMLLLAGQAKKMCFLACKKLQLFASVVFPKKEF